MSYQLGLSPQQEVEKIWVDLEKGIKEAYAHHQMTSERFMQLYSHVFEFCSKHARHHSTPKVVNHEEWVQRRLLPSRKHQAEGMKNDDQSFDGNDLYRRITNFLQSYCEGLVLNAKDLDREELVKFYLQAWDTYSFSSKVFNGFCSYLNRHWIQQQNRENEDQEVPILEIYPLCVEVWKDVAFEELYEPVISFILQLIQSSRQGDVVCSSLIKGVTENLIEMGRDKKFYLFQSQSKGFLRSQLELQVQDELSMYRRRFEDKFLQLTADFYVQDSELFLQTNGNLQEYMKMVEQYLHDEGRRVGLYLHSTTFNSLMKTCEEILIQNRLPRFYEEFPNLLKQDDEESLGRMYELVGRLPHSFGNMAEQLMTHVEQEGKEKIRENVDSFDVSKKLGFQDFFNTVIAIHKKYHDLVSNQFRNNFCFISAVEKGFETFLDENELTKTNPHVVAILLSKYCDALLRKNGIKTTGDEQLEDMLNQTVRKDLHKIVIFKFIKDKDAFQQYFKQYLAKRLVNLSSANDDMEAQMIVKLKQVCGHDYTKNMHKMYQDMSLSKDSNEEFKAWMKNNKKQRLRIDLNVMVLQSGAWPFNPDRIENFTLPSELAPCIQMYQEFYAWKHTSGTRKLSWLHSRGRGELQATYFGKETKRYTFVCSTYQLAILLQFQDRDSLTLQEIADGVQLDLETLVGPIVEQLIQKGVLKKPEKEKPVEPQTNVEFQTKFKSKSFRVMLMAPLKAEVKMENEKCEDNISAGRLHEIQAAMVRIMKTRKTITGRELEMETVSQVKGRFVPEVKIIKSAIKLLIEKEYLKVQDNQDVSDRRNWGSWIYEYMA